MVGSPHAGTGKQGRGAASGPGFVDHFFPDAFGLEDDLDEFACGTFAAIGFGGVVGGPADFRGGVVNGDGQSYPLHERQVRQVIAEKGDFRFLGAGFRQDVFLCAPRVSRPELVMSSNDSAKVRTARPRQASPYTCYMPAVSWESSSNVINHLTNASVQSIFPRG